MARAKKKMRKRYRLDSASIPTKIIYILQLKNPPFFKDAVAAQPATIPIRSSATTRTTQSLETGRGGELIPFAYV